MVRDGYLTLPRNPGCGYFSNIRPVWNPAPDGLEQAFCLPSFLGRAPVVLEDLVQSAAGLRDDGFWSEYRQELISSWSHAMSSFRGHAIHVGP